MTTRTATTKSAKPADDKPFDFNLDAVEAEVDLTPFRVHAGGRRFEFAHMQSLDAWHLIESAEKGDLHAMLTAMEMALGDQWADFRALPLPQYKLMPLFEAWQKHCGVEPGESQASDDS
jgi:hypothetical protein